MCIQKFRPVKGLLKLLGCIGWECPSCVLGIYAAVLRVTIIQPAFKEAIVKLYDKQKLLYLYEEDDFFPITN